MIRWFLAAAALLFLLTAACSNATTTIPTATIPDVTGNSQSPTNTVTVLPTAPNTATRRPTATAVVLPTPHPGTTEWVKARLDGVIALYQPTETGEALLRSLDLRQMEGEPGFFGSFGFDKWAGVGEAKPIGVIHELSHSYS